MSHKVRMKIIDYLSTHSFLRLATVSPEGDPCAHTLRYVSEAATVYFMSDLNTTKVKNILSRPRIAFTVDEDCPDPRQIQGVQMRGTAEIVTDEKEKERIRELFFQKFPKLRDINPPPREVIVRISPLTGNYLDNTYALDFIEHTFFPNLE
ncbi:MAG: pyridoxamine 5'-phosphate oxidase family protein [Proteobacteria bacterium]|nr:pyridoxamine 5'-phosphate oxidase family protein [Pseudomonadota bacterium]